MSTRAAEELYYDSEATFRLLDTALDELQVMEPTVGRFDDHDKLHVQRLAQEPEVMNDLALLLVRAFGEVQTLLHSVRRSRDVLERTTAEKARHPEGPVREIDSAATSVDRAIALVDRLGSSAAGADDAELRDALRAELDEVMGCLQFQDITSQQLSYALSVLSDVESQLGSLACAFDPALIGTPVSHPDEPCDQAFVDAVFGR
jgi:hypothetical protein